MKHSNEHITPTNDINFDTLVEYWINSKQTRLKPSSVQKYLSIYSKHIKHHLGQCNITVFSTSLFDSYLSKLYLSSNVSDNTFNLARYIIKAVLIYGYDKNYIPLIQITVESAAKKRPRIEILNELEAQSLTQESITEKSPTSLAISISLYTGMRLGEICALQRSKFDFDNEIIVVQQTVQRLYKTSSKKTSLVINTPKSKSSLREIPISPNLMDILVKYGIKEMLPDNYILSKSSSPYEPRTLQYGFHRILEKNSIKTIHFHCLRHTFATNCLRSGMDIKTLSEILGHANINTTLNIYVHTNMDESFCHPAYFLIIERVTPYHLLS